MKKKKVSHYEPKYLNIFVFSTSIFLFFKSNFNHLKIIEEKNNIIQKIAKFTFGIYLIIENIMRKLNLFDLEFNIIFLIPIINLVLFLFCLLICIILNYIPIIGRNLI